MGGASASRHKIGGAECGRSHELGALASVRQDSTMGVAVRKSNGVHPRCSLRSNQLGVDRVNHTVQVTHGQNRAAGVASQVK